MPLGWGDLYEVSNFGNFRRLPWKRPVNPWTSSNGYLAVSLSRSSRVTKYRAHRMVAIAFLGDPAEGMDVCHIDGTRTNNSVSNLRWDTRSGNFRDKRAHGTNVQVNRTLCPRDHPLTGRNLVPVKQRNGIRECRSCNQARGFIRYHGLPNDLFDDVAATYLWKFSTEKEAA